MIEIIHREARAPRARAVIFDFDGTLSLIRSGWSDLMISMMLETLGNGGQERTFLEDLILPLTGKETIYQMIAFADEVKRRGGAPVDPHEYQRRFWDQLGGITSRRIEGLRTGRIAPDELLVPGARPLIEELRGRGLVLYLASGTDETCVKREAALLDITKYFDSRIYGARYGGSFAKREVVDDIANANRANSGYLVGFGDGAIEIEEVKRGGGIAVGVATKEPECRRIDTAKRRLLIGAGADYIIPHYLYAEDLLRSVFPG